MAPNLLTTAEAATYLSLSPRTLEDWRYRLVGPQYVRVSGKAIRYRPEDLEKWVDESVETGQP